VVVDDEGRILGTLTPAAAVSAIEREAEQARIGSAP
jgi:hypothetical protein